MDYINSWGIKKFIIVVLTILSAMAGLVGLDTLGFDIPVLRQIVGFIFLTFVPGLLLLRILKLHRLGAIETLLYSVGLSIAFVMFTGFFMNMLYPLIGISRPISILPVMATITFIVLILCAIAYKQESSKKESLPWNSPIRWSELLSPPALFLFLLPILTILGTQLVYLHQDNTVLLILLCLIALTVVLVAFGKFIPIKLCPLALLAISISLLWHWSLIAPGFFGYDINHEYVAQRLTLSNSVWDYTIPGLANAMLSIVMLAPIYSLILNLDTVWVFKIIYLLFFSLVPLALFQAYRKQTSDKIAFLAAFFFMSMPVFFSEMIQLPRQQIAELFLGLSILLFLDKEMATTKRVTLLIIFGFSMAVSHYSLSYIYMLYLLMALPLLRLWRSETAKDLWERIVARFSKSSPGHSDPERREGGEFRPFAIAQGDKINNPPRSILTATYVMFFIVFCLAWYMYVSGGLSFSTMVRIGDHMFYSLRTDLFLLEARDQHIVQALGLMAMRGREIEWEIARVFQQITQLFIVVGILGLIASWRKTRFYHEFAVLSLLSMVMLAMCIIIPHFATALNMSRFYHIILFFLAPFCILGGIATFRRLFRMLRLPRLQGDHTFIKLVVISVVVPYFLFTTGFVFQLTGATPTSMPLSFHQADWQIVTESEIHATSWLATVDREDFMIYMDLHGRGPLYTYGEVNNQRLRLLSDAEPITSPAYIFLRRWNIDPGEIVVIRIVGAQEDLAWIDITGETDIGNAIQERSKIYDNGGAQVLGPR